MKIFASGSCRLLTTINNGYNKIIPIHSMFHNFEGINFLGKLHNTKQHIQFIKFIKDEIILPEYILPKFLTSYNEYTLGCKCEGITLNQIKKENIKKEFDECEWYIFEICSLKLYTLHGFQVQYEHTNDYDCILQSEEELLEDLITLRNLIPSNKKILFQTHFRPNIIYNNENINKRELIYNVIKKFCENNNNNIFIYDPSLLIKLNLSLFDGDTHFTTNGHLESFNYILNLISLN